MLDMRFTPLIFSSQRCNNNEFQNKVSQSFLGGVWRFGQCPKIGIFFLDSFPNSISLFTGARIYMYNQSVFFHWSISLFTGVDVCLLKYLFVYLIIIFVNCSIHLFSCSLMYLIKCLIVYKSSIDYTGGVEQLICGGLGDGIGCVHDEVQQGCRKGGACTASSPTRAEDGGSSQQEVGHGDRGVRGG